jgi:hypothetical protein
LLFLPRFHERRQTRVGRLSGGVVVWVARHGCRASAAGPGMALRRVPTPRHRSEGTAAKRGPYASAMVLVTFVETKVTRPSGRNQTQQRQNAVVATRFKAQHSQWRLPSTQLPRTHTQSLPENGRHMRL